MPQMMPINWIFYFFFFIIIFLLFNIMNYYIFFTPLKSNFKMSSMKKNYFNWKW
uniref:ATP synthase F0 subunit 8 n=1 Tax=Ixias pyrene TaxID=320243 RepID=UPI00237AA302|nr:ATP synthase F0 subunit 8 [Ixias pyrene]WBV74665.1 ATP synthase F0 subunit 8 [Ixias pyrene]